MFKFEAISNEKFEALYEEGMREFFEKTNPETFKHKIGKYKAAGQMFFDVNDISSATLVEIITEISRLHYTKPGTLIRVPKYTKFKGLWQYVLYSSYDYKLLNNICREIAYRYNLEIRW